MQNTIYFSVKIEGHLTFSLNLTFRVEEDECKETKHVNQELKKKEARSKVA